MKYILTVLLLTSSIAHADDVAFGTLKGIKVYGYGPSKTTKLYFSDNATYQRVEGCNLIANIRHD